MHRPLAHQAHRTSRWAFFVGLSLLGLSGCAEIQVQRLAPPTQLSTGDPHGSCERADWLEVVPSKVSVRVPQATPTNVGSTTLYGSSGQAIGYFPGSKTTTGGASVEGWSLYAPKGSEPLMLDDILPKLDEPGLARARDARLAPIRSAETASDLMRNGGVVLAFAGVALISIGGVIATSTPPYSEETEAAYDAQLSLAISTVIIGGLASVLGGLGAVGYLLTRPSASQIANLRARERAFVPGEDDLDAVRRGVQRHNQRTRARCSP